MRGAFPVAALGIALAVGSWAQSAATAADAGKDSASSIKVKPGSINDINAVGKRRIGGRGWGNLYSDGFESAMGKQYAEEIAASVPMITDAAVVEFVNRVGQRLVANSDCKAPFTIWVIDSEEINAFALPGGYLFVSAGLLMEAEDEGELAGVMAHEIAHVCAHHAAREMTRMNYAQVGAIPLMMVGAGAGATALAIPVAFNQFSRSFEEEADYLGVQYMYLAGYDPQAYIRFFEKIEALKQHRQGAVAKAFSGHPPTPERIERVQAEIARILPARAERPVESVELNGVKARLREIEQRNGSGKDVPAAPQENLR
jgi:predicted Zn-dependent protease